jgi:putative phosphoesterase
VQTPRTIRVGILSDTHSNIALTKRAIDFLQRQKVEYLIHAGDFQTPDVLEMIKKSAIPYVGVFGNNDRELIGLEGINVYNEPYYFKIANYTFKLMHMPYYLSGDSDVIIYGHLHKFDAVYKHGSLFLGAGEVCAREKDRSEVIVLSLEKERYSVEYCYNELDDVWKKEEFIFERE